MFVLEHASRRYLLLDLMGRGVHRKCVHRKIVWELMMEGLLKKHYHRKVTKGRIV